MRIQCIGLTANLVHRIGQPFRGRRRGHTLSDALVALWRTKLSGEVLLARNALARDPVVQEIWMPMNLDGHVWFEPDGLFQPALADEAPRANHIGNDVDAHRRLIGHGRAPTGAKLCPRS